jgi:hypothetical protein
VTNESDPRIWVSGGGRSFPLCDGCSPAPRLDDYDRVAALCVAAVADASPPADPPPLDGEQGRGVDSGYGWPVAVARDASDGSWCAHSYVEGAWHLSSGPTWTRTITAWALAERERADHAEVELARLRAMRDGSWPMDHVVEQRDAERARAERAEAIAAAERRLRFAEKALMVPRHRGDMTAEQWREVAGAVAALVALGVDA